MLDRVLERLEASPRIYKLILAAWGCVPHGTKVSVLRLVNPSVTLGAVAVIIDRDASAAEQNVLLGFHTYHARQGTPWALLGGALKARDAVSPDMLIAIPENAVVREVREETALEIAVVGLIALDMDWSTRTLDFYFRCTLCAHGPDLEHVRLSPEIDRLAWFRLSDLPDEMLPQHKRFLTDVLPRVHTLPALPWTAH